MTRFPNRPEGDEPYQPLFHDPVPDELEDAIAAEQEELRLQSETAMPDAADWIEEDDEDKRERMLARRDFFKASAWVRDLILVVLFTVGSLLLIWLIVSMVHMTVEDLKLRFTVLQNLGGQAGGPHYG